MLFDVREPLPDPASTLHPLLRPTPLNVALWTLLLAALVAGVILLVRYLRKPAPPIPAAELARGRLREAAARLEVGDLRGWCNLSSAILRDYIEATTPLRARSQTTEEFLPRARDHQSLAGEPAELLGRFLTLIDQVRYADYTLTEAERAELPKLPDAFIDTAAQPAPTETARAA